MNGKEQDNYKYPRDEIKNQLNISCFDCFGAFGVNNFCFPDLLKIKIMPIKEKFIGHF